MTSPQEMTAIARLLDEAALDRTPTLQLSARGNRLSLPQAYAVQRALLQRRMARGERLVGVKMGFTSAAKREQMGIEDLIWGRLTDAMQLSSGGQISLGGFIHPRVEPEVAFLLKRPLAGKVSRAEALAAVEAVAPALEILDSRYRDFRFSLADVVADNSSSAAFVLGAWQPPPAALAGLSIVMSFDEQPVQRGSSADVMGDPLLSLVAAARLAAEEEVTLAAGWLVLSGGATAAEPLRVHTRASAAVQSLGSVDLQVLP